MRTLILLLSLSMPLSMLTLQNAQAADINDLERRVEKIERDLFGWSSSDHLSERIKKIETRTDKIERDFFGIFSSDNIKDRVEKIEDRIGRDSYHGNSIEEKLKETNKKISEQEKTLQEQKRTIKELQDKIKSLESKIK